MNDENDENEGDTKMSEEFRKRLEEQKTQGDQLRHEAAERRKLEKEAAQKAAIQFRERLESLEPVLEELLDDVASGGVKVVRPDKNPHLRNYTIHAGPPQSYLRFTIDKKQLTFGYEKHPASGIPPNSVIGVSESERLPDQGRLEDLVAKYLREPIAALNPWA